MKTLRRNSTKTKGEGLYSFPFNPPGSLPSWPGPFPPAGFCLQAASGRPEIPAIHRVVLDTILEGRTRLNRPTDADEGDRR